MKPSDVILDPLERQSGIWKTGKGGYWSNINKNEMKKVLNELSILSSSQFIKQYFPQLEEVIYSPKRVGGIGLFKLRERDVVLDAGCMWGALTVPIARSGCRVIGIDQTYESLIFLKKRLEEEGLDNVELVNANLNDTRLRNNSIDKVVVNGVLEWMAEGNIEVEGYYKKRQMRKNIVDKTLKNPRDIHQSFLEKLCSALRPGGILYLAIENRYDAANFFGYGDPHTGQRFVTIMPRFFQNHFARVVTGRPYRTWIYSEPQLKALLTSAGFDTIQFYYVFPNYRMPELALSKLGMKEFRPVRYLKTRNLINKCFWYGLEQIFYKLLRLTYFSPSFIVIAERVSDND